MVSRRKFIKRGALWVPFIFAPKLLRAGPPFTHPSFWKRPPAGGGGGGIITSDSFDHASGSILGETLGNELGGSGSYTWQYQSGGFFWFYGAGGTANKCIQQDIGSDNFVALSGGGAADRIASIKTYGNDGGVILRWGSDSCYLAYRASSVLKLFKRVSGSFTQLGSDGPSISDGDTVELRCIGTTISARLNGVEQISVTDSAVASGVAGLYGGGGGTFVCDDFIFSS